MKTRNLVLLVFLLFPNPLWARNTSFMGLTSYYSAYNDLSLSEGDAKTELPKSLDVECTLRFKSIFNLVFIISKFMHDEDSSVGSLRAERDVFGFGLKVDLPGIFFVGGTTGFSRRKGKRWPINTFMYGSMNRVNTTNLVGTKDSSMSTRYGLGMDLFLFNKIAYLSFYFGGFQYDTNTYLQSGAGIGVTL